MKLLSHSFANNQFIPSEFAFGKSGSGSPCVLSDNKNPHFAWSEVPPDTQSFVLLCVDKDVPTKPDDVNKEGRQISAALPRCDFIHWLMIDIPAHCREIAAGSCSDGIVARGKRNPPGPRGSRQGINDYTGWFSGDDDMAGDYYGYDGPCPPWNDELLHHYHFIIYALGKEKLNVAERFTMADIQRAIAGHVLAEAQCVGTYTLNAALKG